MSGTVLLVDDVSTSRIILKVKLSAAYYDVEQAATLDEARNCILHRRPDLILVRGQLVHANMAASLRALRPEDDGPEIPAILLVDKSNKSLRINGLKAGFADVITCPTPEKFLLARLRGLLRQRHQSQDLHKHSIAARALGFAERQHTFAHNAAITLATDDPVWGTRLRGMLGKHMPHTIRTIGTETLMGPNKHLRQQNAQPDMFIADLRHARREVGLRLVADLRTMVGVPDCPILPFVARDMPELAAALLDMGASEVLFDDTDPLEMALRLIGQLDRKRASDQMRDQIKHSLQAAMTDPLTGLYNRRYALSFLNCLLMEENRNFAIMVADLDHFKQINDTFGHAAGDKVLVRVANTLRMRLGAGDLVARIGGEEFLIILPNTSRARAQSFAQTLCGAVRSVSLRLPEKGVSVGVTISIGVTIAKGQQRLGARCDHMATALLEQADRALYKSKAEGRNTVTLSTRSAA